MHTPDQSRLPLRTQQERSIPGVCLLPGLISKAMRSPASPSTPGVWGGGEAKPTFSEGGPQAWGEKNAAFEFHGRREVVDISDPMSLENYQSQKDSIQPFLSRHTPLGHILQARLGSHHRGHRVWEGRKWKADSPQSAPRSASAWVPPAPTAPQASPAPPAGSWPLSRGLEVSSGASPRARPRRGLTGVSAVTDPRPNRRGVSLTSAAARLGFRYARRPGRAATPTPFPFRSGRAARPCPDPPPLLPPAETAPPPPRPLCSPYWSPGSRPRPTSPLTLRIGQIRVEAARPQARSRGLPWVSISGLPCQSKRSAYLSS